MGMTAFVVFTSCGAAAGTAAGIRAIRHDGHGPRAVAYWSLSAVVLGAFMTLQAGLTLTRADVIDYARSVIDVVVQLTRTSGRRGVSQVVFHRRQA